MGIILAVSQNMYFCMTVISKAKLSTVGFGRVVSQFSRIWDFGWGFFFFQFEKLFYGHFYRGCKVQHGFLCNDFILPMFHYYDQTTDEEGWGSFPRGRMNLIKKKKVVICSLN